ncbi:hypothetical protein Plhal710r2_c020g0086251 [Plasmopara halstedii]
MELACIVAKPNSWRSSLRNIISCMQWHRAMYSASVVDITTVWCLRESHEIGLLANIVTYPPTERLVSGQLA